MKICKPCVRAGEILADTYVPLSDVRYMHRLCDHDGCDCDHKVPES